MKRRNFLRGLIGVAAIPLVGLPAPAFEVTGNAAVYFHDPELLAAFKKTQEELVNGIIDNILTVNPMYGDMLICPPSASKAAVISDTAAADAGYCGLLRASLRT